MLANQQFTVKAATSLAVVENYCPYVAVDSQKTIMMVIGEADYGLLIEIFPYDEATYTEMTYYESFATELWPTDLITSTFSSDFNAIIPVYSQEAIFSSTVFYTGSELNPWIQLSSDQTSLEDVRTYVASLFNANWSLDMVEDEINNLYTYLLVDSTQTVMLIIHFTDGYIPFFTMEITHYSESAYQDAYDSMFPEVPM